MPELRPEIWEVQSQDAGRVGVQCGPLPWTVVSCLDVISFERGGRVAL